MTTTNNMVAKIAAAVAGLGLVFAAFAPAASAQSNEAMEAQIAALMAQIAALQAQSGGSASASMMFTRDLTIGASGADVTALQNWLIKGGYAIPAGATGYFGAQTAAALGRYQAAMGISPAAGYFGPITRAKVNASAGGNTGGNTGGNDDDDDDNDDDDNDDNDDDDNDELDGGEASLEDLKANDGDDDDVEEGEEADVAEFEFDVEDGDVRIDRLDLAFELTNDATGREDEPWETFETVTIMDEDGEELASEDVSDEDDWLENDDEPYEFRFTDLDYIVREGEMGMLKIRVEAQDGIDGIEDDLTWELSIQEDGLRGTDGEDIEQYLGDEDETTTFDVVEEGEDDDLSVRRSSDDPDSTTFEVEDDGTSDWFKIQTFDFDSDEDSDDIEVNEIGIVVTTSGTTTANVINDLMLKIDGEEYDDFDRASATTSTTTYNFDTEDDDLVVKGGERTKVEVWAEFKSRTAANYPEGQTVQSSVDGDDIEAEGADDIVVDGSATGDVHTLRVMGIDVDVTDTSSDVREPDGIDNNVVTFQVKANIEAFEQDVFIRQAASAAFTFQIENASTGAVVATGTSTPSLSSSADTETAGGNTYYVVDEGSDEDFTFQVTYNPTVSGDYRLQILTVVFNDEPSTTGTQTYNAEPMNDFESDSDFVNAD